MRYAIVIEQAESNFSAYVPDLPGCVATGGSLGRNRARDSRSNCIPPRRPSRGRAATTASGERGRVRRDRRLTIIQDDHQRGSVSYQPTAALRRRLNAALGIMIVTTAGPTDLDHAVACLAAAFAQDPITGFLLESGPNYADRVTHFFSLLMRARMGLEMPVLIARDAARIRGAAMGYTTARPPWPPAIAEDWDRFKRGVAGMTDRLALYDEIAERNKPPAPHYYLGVIGADPSMHGLGIGSLLLKSFCALSASDPLSSGVYLETANPSNVRFYEGAGFVETGRGVLGAATLWCMFLAHK
jgi:ribosomal protein S18 acetylase RimI-like enzyme